MPVCATDWMELVWAKVKVSYNTADNTQKTEA